MERFKLEIRSGIIALQDTHHPEFRETEGCSSEFPWNIKTWCGNFNKEKGHWEMSKKQIQEAKELCKELNNLNRKKNLSSKEILLLILNGRLPE